MMLQSSGKGLCMTMATAVYSDVILPLKMSMCSNLHSIFEKLNSFL